MHFFSISTEDFILSYKLALRHLFIICCLSFFHCANTSKLNQMLLDHREDDKSRAQQVEALSRENTILFEAKNELEKENTRLKKTMENTRAQHTIEMEKIRAQLAIEKGNYSSFYDSTRKKNVEYQQQILLSQEKFAKRINDLNNRNEKTADSLSHRIESLSALLSSVRDSLALEVLNLKNQLAKETLDCEKELYSLKRIKDELFEKLQKQDRKIQQLISSCLQSPKEIDSVSVKDR
jgi:hypothetical protein